MIKALESVSWIKLTRSGLVLGDQLLVSGSRFVATWMVARFCGAEQLGYYALGFSILVLIDLLLQAFVSAPFTVFCQKSVDHRLRHYTGDAILQSFLVGLIGSVVFAIIGILSQWNSSPVLAKMMFVLAASAWICPVREFSRRFCFAKNFWGKAFAFDAIQCVSQIALMFLCLKLDQLDAINAHLAGIAASILTVVIWSIVSRASFKFGSKRYPLHFRKHFRFGRWVFVSQTTNQLNWNVVQWILAYWLSAEATGVFSGCLTIAFLSNPFVLGVANVIYPRMAMAFAKDGEEAMQSSAIKACSGIAVVMVSFTLMLLVFGQNACDFLYNDAAFSRSSLMLASLAAAVSCLAITMPLDACLWARQRAKHSSVASATGFVVTSLAVLSLVRLGTTASSIGLLVGCLAEAIVRIRLFRNVQNRLIGPTSVAS